MDEFTLDVTRLLIVDATTEGADRLINIFRDAGQVTRANHITCLDSLEKAFLDKQKWDLLIIAKVPETLALTDLLECLENQSADIPIIVIADYKEGSEQMDYLRKGIKAVIPPDQEEMLLLKARHEIENLYIRRNYRRMSVALHESERQRSLLLDDEVDAIAYLNDGVIRYANPAFCELLKQKDSSLLIGQPFSRFVDGSDSEHVTIFLENMEETGQTLGVLQCSILLEHGELLPIRGVIKPTSYDGTFSLSLQLKLADSPISEQVSDEETPIHIDPTGLTTKDDLLNLLEISVQQVASGKGQVTLLYGSIDGLADIHKNKGIRVSQKVEKTVTDSLLNILESTHPVAALGGGCFLILLHINSENSVQDITHTIMEKVTHIQLDDKSIKATLSMGAIVLGDTGKDAETLIVRAKEACTQAQKDGGGKLAYYKPRKVSVVKSVEKHLAVMLSQAMKSNTLKLYYQPVVSLKGAESHYYEVLFSMTDIRGREHQATNFRAKLDNESLWKRVDRWQLIEASKALLEKHQDNPETRLFIHLGGCALTDEKFIPWFTSAIQQAQLPPSALVLELSEVNVTRYKKAAPAFFAAAKKAACQTSVSQFGCSANPLEIIESVDTDFIKIDPSFTKDLTTENRGEKIRQMLTTLTEKGKQIIVPEVKNTASVASLWHTGVDFVQGEFLQAPQEKMDYSFDSDF